MKPISTGINLEIAQENYKAAIGCEKNVLESYENLEVKDRSVTKPSLKEIRRSILYWERVCNKLNQQ